MFKSGVVSVSFRPHSVEDIIKASADAKLSLVEWGSDVHSPAGDAKRAEEISALSKNAGLGTVTYGSYFRIGVTPAEQFTDYLESAKALGANVIRVWAYRRHIPECAGEEWELAVSEAKKICDMAESYGIKVCLECHNSTLTQDYCTALGFLKAVNHKSLGMYWQPNQLKSLEYNLDAAKALAEYVECLHVFHFIDGVKATLAAGIEDWKKYLAVFKETIKDKTLPLLLEFMPDDKIESLAAEAKTLNELVSSMQY